MTTENYGLGDTVHTKGEKATEPQAFESNVHGYTQPKAVHATATVLNRAARRPLGERPRPPPRSS